MHANTLAFAGSYSKPQLRDCVVAFLLLCIWLGGEVLFEADVGWTSVDWELDLKEPGFFKIERNTTCFDASTFSGRGIRWSLVISVAVLLWAQSCRRIRHSCARDAFSMAVSR